MRTIGPAATSALLGTARENACTVFPMHSFNLPQVRPAAEIIPANLVEMRCGSDLGTWKLGERV